MSRIEAKFESLRASGEKALVVFVTAGDQPMSELPDLLDLLAESGADIIELGIPFSDPFGEGPIIQASSQRALEHGTNAKQILEALRGYDAKVPLVTMGYYNTYLRFGLEDMAKASAEVGISGAIISDLVPDEGQKWGEAAHAYGLDTIYLAAPTSTDQRIQDVCSMTTGFVYAVSRTGVTGKVEADTDQVGGLVSRIRANTDLPICIGFGISRPEQVRAMCSIADGAVVGSSLVEMLNREWPNKSAIRDYVSELKAATRA